MAPEIHDSKASGGRMYDAFQADMWSAGVVLFIMLAGCPPFSKPDKSDWWYDKLSRNRLDLFWRAHCRTVQFSDDAKDLIIKMLTIDPQKRIELKDVSTHPFFTGTILSPEALAAELAHKKTIVDQAKAREKFQQMARQGNVGGGNDIVTRAGAVKIAADDVDEMPPFAPSLDIFVPAGNEEHDASADEDDGDDDVDIEIDNEAPEFVADGPVCYTQFDSDLPPAQLLFSLKRELGKLLKRLKVTPEAYKLKGTTLGERLSIAVQVYKKGTGSTAEFRRIYGDMFEFKNLYLNARAIVLTSG